MSNFPPDPDEFGIASIKVLRFPECFRVRPQMYVGDVRDGSGLQNMINYTVDDALARRPARVTVSLCARGLVVVTDDGLSFPFAGSFVGSLSTEGDSRVPGSIARAAETALTMLDTHGTGRALPVVNGLSSRFDARLWRDGAEYVIGFEEGQLVAPLVRIGGAPSISGLPRRGTAISFLASSEIFGPIAYDETVIRRHLDDFSKKRPDVCFALE